MATQSDHVQATIAQMQEAIREQERVLLEMRETLAALQGTPNYLKGVTLPHLTREPVVEKSARTGTRQLANRNVTPFRRATLAEHRKYDDKVNINETLTYL